MSTAELSVNAWTQSENTLAATQAWAALEEWEEPAAEEAAPSLPQPEQAEEPSPGLPDNFWQDWFGIWT